MAQHDENDDTMDDVELVEPSEEESSAPAAGPTYNTDPDSVEGEILAGTTKSDLAAALDAGGVTVKEEPTAEEAKKEPEAVQTTKIYALRTTANREDQVLAFVGSNAARKKLPVYAVIVPHGMRGYIFVEAEDQQAAEMAAQGVPYAKGVIPKEIAYKEIEHMLEQVKKEITIQKNDIVEIIAGPFKRENAKISRVDKGKEEVVVELLEAAVPIPITLKLDDVKVIRREE